MLTIMKTNLIKFIPVTIAILILISGCKKKDDGPEQFNFRIISVKTYTNNKLDGQSSVEYSGDRISKVSDTQTTPPENYLFTYPDNDKINISYTYTEGGVVKTETINATLNNNKITEILDVYGTDKYKTTLSYNADGKVEKISEYDFTSTWVLNRDETYTYGSGKLIQLLSTGYGSTPNYEDKNVYSYNGDELKEVIYSYRQTGGTWTESSKSVYTYTSGKVSKITDNYKNGTAWTESGRSEYSYDIDGNLTKELNYSGTNIYSTEYTYEKGSGNFRLIYNIMSSGNYDNIYPIPTKKSQTVEGNTVHNFNRGRSFSNRSFKFLSIDN